MRTYNKDDPYDYLTEPRPARDELHAIAIGIWILVGFEVGSAILGWFR